MKNADDIVTELKHKQQQMLEYLQKHWGLFLAEGIFFMLLGIAAIVIPQVISVVIVIFLGWIIVLAGAMHMSRALFFRDMPGFGLWLGLGILQIAVGYLLIADPISGVLTLTMMMTLFFALEGVIKIYLGFMMRPLPQWNVVLFSGVTALFFAAIILAFWSETEHWLLGLFLGINMIILGGSMVIMSLRHKDNHS
ncbi:HdeD family acid-resistance protein [Methyloglobulus sp.]|uniref:HdeD family acid-resistance protein n=1 Tax=Methyloglobulus sp. TaxID=2518622 RepID=UPI003988BB20